MDSSHNSSQCKKLYEIILSNGSEVKLKKEAILSLIRMAVSDHSLFSFLLNQIDWFCQNSIQLLPVLSKVLRAYHGTSRTAYKVIYNLLSTGFCIPGVNLQIVDILVNISQAFKELTLAIDSLKENYPHKVCSIQIHVTYVQSLLQLSLKDPSLRFKLLQLIIENLVAFDTESILGESFMYKPVYKDDEVLQLVQKSGPLQNKYDQILSRVIQYLSKFDSKGKQLILKQIYLLFEKVMMTIENTKMIQYVPFYLAQSSAQCSSIFLSLLMATIFENYTSKNSRKNFIASLQYIRSYLNRSTIVSAKTMKKIYEKLVCLLQAGMCQIKKTHFDQLKIQEFSQLNNFHLYLLETVVYLKYKFFKNSKSINSKIDAILQEAYQKLHAQIFLDKKILSLLNQQKKPIITKSNKYETKFVDKFLPIFLPKTSGYVNLRLQVDQKRQRYIESLQESTQICQYASIVCRKMKSSMNQTQGSFTVEQYSN